MDDCLFCKMTAGEVPVNKVYEDEEMILIPDIAPQSKIHLLMIPKRHYRNVTELDAENAVILGNCLRKVGAMAEALGLGGGFRIVMNAGADGRQSIGHLHAHILGGEELSDKMG